MTRVSIYALTKRIGRVAVLDRASLELRAGEISVLLGPPGSGKTTLARVVAGLDRADDGEVFIDDRVVNDLPPADRRVGLVGREDALWPHLSVAENVGFGLKIRGVGRRERRGRVAETLGLIGIDSLADTLPGALAPPQALRVAIARALAIEPVLLILDEPFARLAPPARSEAREGLRRVLAETRTTTLVLTDDPREALVTADRLAVIDFGRVVQVGEPGEVYARPVDAFVARCLGPVNLVPGQVEGPDSHGDLVVRTGLGRLIGRAAPGSGEVATGTPVTLAIRPESIGLGPTTPPDANRFAATVDRLTLLGEVRQVDLRGPGDWPVTALALPGPSSGLREGQSLTASVTPESVVVLAGRRGDGA